MREKNLLDLDLQFFAEEEVADVEESEAVEPTEETSDAESEETVENDGNDEPHEQTAEENARYAAIRRRAEEDARRRYEGELNSYNQQIAALCQGVKHPVTGQPITNMRDYVDALTTQQRMQREQELKEKGIDPSMIDQMIAQNPVVMQAQQVIEQTQMANAQQQLQNDMAELARFGVKDINELAALPTFPQMLDYVNRNRGASIVDAFKVFNFDTAIQHTEGAARQQAINQMRGKSHLASLPQGVATETDEVEVPAEIMKSWKAEGKTEKQIRDLYKTVAGKLHLN